MNLLKLVPFESFVALTLVAIIKSVTYLNHLDHFKEKHND